MRDRQRVFRRGEWACMPHNIHILKENVLFGPGETTGKVCLWWIKQLSTACSWPPVFWCNLHFKLSIKRRRKKEVYPNQSKCTVSHNYCEMQRSSSYCIITLRNNLAWSPINYINSLCVFIHNSIFHKNTPLFFCAKDINWIGTLHLFYMNFNEKTLIWTPAHVSLKFKCYATKEKKRSDLVAAHHALML